MTIALDIGGSLALSSYTELQAAISDWLKDSGLSAQTDTFISLVEAQFNRQLRVPEMETFTTLTTTTDSIPLPSDFLEAKAIWTGRYSPLKPMTIYELQTNFAPVESSVLPEYFTNYAIVGSTMYLGLTPSASTTFSLHYYKKIPTLSAATQSNWMLESHPDAYLYGALTCAELRGWNDERLPLLQTWFGEVLDQIKTSAITKSYGGGPLVPQTGVRQYCGARS